MVRKMKPEDVARVMELWLAGNRQAHSFIPAEYWISHKPVVEKLIPLADVFVFERSQDILGFAGVMDGELAGIFVDAAHRSEGIGKSLLDAVKADYPRFTLHVYEKNRRAVKFYLREGLSLIERGTDEDTGEKEYTMSFGLDKCQ